MDAVESLVVQINAADNQKHFIDTQQLAAGAYLLKVGNTVQHIIKK